MSNNKQTQATEYQVAPIELFFDLIFVFAISQLSHHLAAHFSWQGAAETGILLLAVTCVWAYTSWVATMIPVHRPSSAWMLIAIMLLGLIMNASIGDAFATTAWSFVIPLLVIQLGRTLWTIIYAPDSAYKEHFIRVLIWLLLTTPLWLLGALAQGEQRLGYWAAAVIIELLGTWFAHPVPGRKAKTEHWPFNAEHMLERCNLFIIIALGETVLMAGIALAEHPTNLLTLMTGTSAMVGIIALWALAFGSIQTHTEHHLKKTLDPVKVSRHAMNTLTIMVAGLVLLAVANEKIIHHPQGHASLALGFTASIGAAIFLLAQSWYLHSVLKVRSHIHWLGALAITPVGAAALVLPPYGITLVISGLLAIFAGYDWTKRKF